MTAREKWGIPDWTDANAYPSLGANIQMRQWAWEFMRRNPQYRDFWSLKCLPFRSKDGSYGDDFSPYIEELRNKFGIVLFPSDPTYSEAPWFSNADVVRQIGGRTIKGEISLTLDVTEVGFIFDMTRPLKVQFALAEKKAKALQDHREKQNNWEIKAAREKTEKYSIYLRIIDAYDAGARAREIADALFPEIDHFSPESPRDKTLQNHRTAAFELRDSRYRGLYEMASNPARSK